MESASKVEWTEASLNITYDKKNMGRGTHLFHIRVAKEITIIPMTRWQIAVTGFWFMWKAIWK